MSESAANDNQSAQPVAEDCKIEGIDNQARAIKNAFSRRDAGSQPSQACADELETLTLVSSFYPAGVAKQVVLKKSAARKSELGSLIGLDDSLFCLDVGANPTTVKVAYVHPDNHASFRPGRGEDHDKRLLFERKEFNNVEQQQAQAVPPDGDKSEPITFIESTTLNGVEMKDGSWFYFVRSHLRDGTVDDVLNHRSTHVGLGCLLKQTKRTNQEGRKLFHFIYAYRRENGVMRVTRCTQDWIHDTVPAKFQEILNSDKDALKPFTIADPNTAKLLTQELAKVMARSDQQMEVKKARSVSEESASDASHGSDQQLLQELTATKGELASLKLQVAALKSGDEETKRVTENALALHAEERKSKLEAQKQAAVWMKQALDSKKAREAEMLHLQAKLTELQEQHAGMVTQYGNVQRANNRNKENNMKLREDMKDLKARATEEMSAVTEREALAKAEFAKRVSQLEKDLKEANLSLESARESSSKLKEKAKNYRKELDIARAQLDILKVRGSDMGSKERRRSPSRRSPSSASSTSSSSDAIPAKAKHKRKHKQESSKKSKKAQLEEDSSSSDSDSAKKQTPLRKKHRRHA